MPNIRTRKMTKNNNISEKEITEAREALETLEKEIRKVFYGHDRVVEEILWALMAGGHCLLEGLPGLGKTILVKALASGLGLEFSRIQFTPDLMPADITGTNILEEDPSGRKMFRFQEGPIFANIVLADEINRATPRTQAALLEAMQENQVTAGGKTRPLPYPFFVIATQNPIELEGTWPLPEAQLDRFLFKVNISLPPEGDLETIIQKTTSTPIPPPQTVIDIERLKKLMALARLVVVPSRVIKAVSRIIMFSNPRENDAPEETSRYVRYGASPRGGQALVLAAKARALFHNRLHVTFEDISDVALPALRHRIVLRFTAENEGITPETLINKWVQRVEKEIKP